MYLLKDSSDFSFEYRDSHDFSRAIRICGSFFCTRGSLLRLGNFVKKKKVFSSTFSSTFLRKVIFLSLVFFLSPHTTFLFLCDRNTGDRKRQTKKTKKKLKIPVALIPVAASRLFVVVFLLVCFFFLHFVT